jgi:hypothetical protein
MNTTLIQSTRALRAACAIVARKNRLRLARHLVVRRVWFAMLLAFLSCGGARTSGAYDAVLDFSNTTNTESSTWSYRNSFSDMLRDGNYELMPVHSDTRPYWNPPTPYWAPFHGYVGIGVNRSGAPIPIASDLPQFTWPNNTIWITPPQGNSLAVVSWLSPVTGLADIEFSFTDIDPNGGSGINYFVDRNNLIGQLAGGTLANGGSTGVVSLTDVAINVGDRINFVVDPGIGGGNEFDSTALTATITVIPEPATLVLSLLGIVGLANWQRQPRQTRPEKA